MTNKDYELVAQVFANNRPIRMSDHEVDCLKWAYEFDLWAEVVKQFCIAALRDNPRFDTSRFVSACGMPAQLSEGIIAQAVRDGGQRRNADMRGAR